MRSNKRQSQKETFNTNRLFLRVRSFFPRKRLVSVLGCTALVLLFLNFSSFLQQYLSPFVPAQHMVSSGISNGIDLDRDHFHDADRDLRIYVHRDGRTVRSRCWGHPEALKYRHFRFNGKMHHDYMHRENKEWDRKEGEHARGGKNRPKTFSLPGDEELDVRIEINGREISIEEKEAKPRPSEI